MLTIEQIKTLINGLKQGIDSAIRKAEKKTESTIAEVNKSIRGVLKRANEAAERANYAFDEAEQARYEAGMAKTAADEALPIITVSRISGGTGEVYEYMPLRDGAVFSLRSTVEGSYSSDPAYLKYNGVTYPIYARNPSMWSYQSLGQIVGNERASRVFRVGMVTLMQYSSTRRAFISLNSYDMREFVRFTTINHGGDPNGGFVMAEEDEDGVVSSLRLRKYPSIPSTSEGSSKRLELRVNDDGMLKTVDPDRGTVSVIPAIAHAGVGQTVRVSAVSDSGVPTAWEAVDTTRSWRLLKTVIIPEDITADSSDVEWLLNDDGTVRGLRITTDGDGNKFSCRKLFIRWHLGSADKSSTKILTVILNKPISELNDNFMLVNAVKNDRTQGTLLIEILDGLNIAYAQWSSANDAGYGGQGTTTMTTPNDWYGGRNGMDVSSINSIVFRAPSDVGIRAGCGFRIWGLDA